MDTINSWLNSLRCPDCHGTLGTAEGKSETVNCSDCGRKFNVSQGIWNFLPIAIEQQEKKDKEKSGWVKKMEEERENGGGHPPAHYLSLPDHPHPYYRFAAWYLRIVLEYGKPWKGKKVLELGAAECWGTRRFAEAGCDAAALDYDPTRMKKGQILLDHLPISFSRFTGDAEELPFKDNSLDSIFCCSVLHHFPNLQKAVREIARTLRPGGVFFGVHEAFHPPYYSKRKILEMSEDTIPNIGVGINESSYTLGSYRRAFTRAGLVLEVLHPRWDVKEDGPLLTVAPNIGILGNPEFVPRMLSERAWRKDLAGYLASALIRSGLWRLAAHPAIFPLLRFQILNWSTKNKVLVARKAVK